MKKWMILALLVLVSQAAFAQKYPERRDIRAGNRVFEGGEYEASSLYYLRALEKAPESVAATGNLAGALYKQEKYEEAARLGEKTARDSSAGSYASQLFYNAGNAHFQQRKLEEAIEAYKNALRRNPYDQEAKFNLAYAQKLRDQDKDDGGGDNDQDDQNQDNQNDRNDQDDQNQDQQNDQNQDDQSEPDQNDQQDQQNPQQDGGEDQPQQPPPNITPQQAEQMLNAMQEADDKTKEKVDAQTVKAVGASGKNW